MSPRFLSRRGQTGTMHEPRVLKLNVRDTRFESAEFFGFLLLIAKFFERPRRRDTNDASNCDCLCDCSFSSKMISKGSHRCLLVKEIGEEEFAGDRFAT